jgi:nitrate reductase molybdenum cofactor assembly chaperone NarJ/NarW
MKLFHTHPPTMARTMRVLAHLLRYPEAALRVHLAELRDALHAERALTFGRLAELDRLVDRLQAAPALEAEAAYVELFDRGRSTSLNLFEHVHGDSRDRGPAMVDLVRHFEAAGLLLGPDELPDHLPVLLEFASTQPAADARAFLGEFAHILSALFAALVKRESAYASAVGALLDLAGHAAQPVTLPDEPALDETWAEPEAFGGCSSAGQAKPGQPQPVQIVRPNRSSVSSLPTPGARA